MDVRFQLAAFPTIAESVRRHLRSLPSPVDSFMEDHIVASTHYQIDMDGHTGGFAAIHAQGLISQFSVLASHKRYGQVLFQRLRRQEQVRSALVPTGDEFFLAHALDDYRQIGMQAYRFEADTVDGPAPPAGPYSLVQATSSDHSLIREEAGDFFDPIERYVGRGELFRTTRAGENVGFGLIARSSFYDDVASIGMFTVPRFRRRGVGAVTIALLIERCRRQGIRPVAGCWY